MFTLLTRRYVHPARSAAEQMIYAATQAATHISEVVMIDEALASVIDRALAFDRDLRWSSAREMQSALRLCERCHKPRTRDSSF